MDGLGGNAPAGAGFGQKTMKRKNKLGLALAPAAPKPQAPPPEDTASGTNVTLPAGKHNRHASTSADKLEIGVEFRLDLRAEDLIVIKELGAGNGGTVSKVQHAATKVIMAKKIIHVEAKKEVRRRIVRELQIMHECNSPSIVSFYGAFMNDTGDVIMCMEYMDVGSLDDISKKFGPVRVDVLGKIADAVLGGLTYLYRAHRIMHRDIKPSNVLVNSKGQIKLCDFGVSGELEGSVAETFVGTGTYMAPERIQGAQYTVKSDVWSVGLTLMELAIGKFPLHNDNADEHDGPQGILDLLTQIVLEPSPRLPKSDAFPAIMDDMIAKCLLKDPAQRPTPAELFEHDPFILAAKRTPVDLEGWAVSMMERTNRRSHLEPTLISPGIPPPLTATTTNSSVSTVPSARGAAALPTPSIDTKAMATPTSGDVEHYMSNLSLDNRDGPKTATYVGSPNYHGQGLYDLGPAPPPSAPLPAAPQKLSIPLANPAAPSVMSATLAGPYDPYEYASYDSYPSPPSKREASGHHYYQQQQQQQQKQIPQQYQQYSMQQQMPSQQQQQQQYQASYGTQQSSHYASSSEGGVRPYPTRTTSASHAVPPTSSTPVSGLGLQYMSQNGSLPRRPVGS